VRVTTLDDEAAAWQLLYEMMSLKLISEKY
jgi:hypothetical protein